MQKWQVLWDNVSIRMHMKIFYSTCVPGVCINLRVCIYPCDIDLTSMQVCTVPTLESVKNSTHYDIMLHNHLQTAWVQKPGRQKCSLFCHYLTVQETHPVVWQEIESNQCDWFDWLILFLQETQSLTCGEKGVVWSFFSLFPVHRQISRPMTTVMGSARRDWGGRAALTSHRFWEQRMILDIILEILDSTLQATTPKSKINFGHYFYCSWLSWLGG